MALSARFVAVPLLLAAAAAAAVAAPQAGGPVFDRADRAVSTWRQEASAALALTPSQAEAIRVEPEPHVARCVKLNNYWCIKKAGWVGTIAADPEGHVAFATATEGAAVAALLLRRYYVDFGLKTARAIVARWAPASCGTAVAARGTGAGSLAQMVVPKGIAATLRARWLASHARGFVTPLPGRRVSVRRSRVPDPVTRSGPTPTIAVGLGEGTGRTVPMTLDALLMADPKAPPSRSMLGMVPRGSSRVAAGSGCGSDMNRLAAYAAKAAEGVAAPDADLALFADGAATPHLATVMRNMARVEIGPAGVTDALVSAGIAEAFRPGRAP